eukprot:403372399
MILVEAFAVLNVYFLDITRKRKQMGIHIGLRDQDQDQCGNKVQRESEPHQDQDCLMIERKIQKINHLIWNDVTRNCCQREQISVRDYQAWAQTSVDGQYLRRVVKQSISKIKRGQKPTIDYEINKNLTPAVLNSVYQKILAIQRYTALKILNQKLQILKSESKNDEKVKLSEKDKQSIMEELQTQKSQIVRSVVQFYDVQVKNENPYVTIKKAYNKYFFDKQWYEEILKLKDEHFRQMAILLNYGDKSKLDLSNSMTMKLQDPMNSKDLQYGSKLIYQIVKNPDLISPETLDMITGKFKVAFVQPPKPYVLKLQRIKDKMAVAMRSKIQNMQAVQDESPNRSEIYGEAQTTKSQKSVIQRKDSMSSQNTVQTMKNTQSSQSTSMKTSIESYLAAKAKQQQRQQQQKPLAQRLFANNAKYTAIFKQSKSLSSQNLDDGHSSISESQSQSQAPIAEEPQNEQEDTYRSHSSQNNYDADERQSQKSNSSREIKFKLASEISKMLHQEKQQTQQQ